MIEFLVPYCELEVKPVGIQECTGLISATRHCDEKVMKAFLSHPHIEVNLSDSMGMTALMCAAQEGFESVAKLLTALVEEGWTALIWAVE